MKENKRGKMIGLALTDQEFYLIKQAAERERIGMASYIRNQVFKTKGLQERPKRKELKENAAD